MRSSVQVKTGDFIVTQCAHCQAEMKIYIGDVPICDECSQARAAKPPTPNVRDVLFRELITATTDAESARNEFVKVTGRIPTGLPHPDGTQRVKNASRELALARERLMKAHNRLNDYLSRGIVPDGLKGDG
jgi:hypothetical protein